VADQASGDTVSGAKAVAPVADMAESDAAVRVFAWAERWSRWPLTRACVAAVLLATLVGWVDYSTGTELRVFPLYFVPVSLFAWRAGLWLGMGFSAACALTWEISNRFAGVHYTQAYVAYANTLALLVAFATVSLLVSALREEIRRVGELARVDPLTGLFNGRAFREFAELELRRARRHRRPLSLVFLDLDGFKAVNDTLGHESGDRLLGAVARAIRSGVRDTDIAARLGGDEFVVLLAETDPRQAEATGTKLRNRLHTAVRSGGWPVTASAGAVSYRTPPADLEDMLRRADTLMYAAKSRNRGGMRLEVVED
jgi:diguanylate cyclase (GGDEF)-like protein